MLRTLRAQVMAEYAVVVSVIVLAIVVMLPLVKRSAQRMIKLAADQIGDQVNADQDFNAQQGYLINSSTATQLTSRTDQTYQPGLTGKIYDDTLITGQSTYTDQGFSAEDQDFVATGEAAGLNTY